jgi:hypothetical protein
MQMLRPPLPITASRVQAALPQTAAWHSAVWRCWAVLAVLGLAAGVAWRIVGDAPPIPLALDGAGLALALSALWLAPAWEKLLHGALRYQPCSPRDAQLLPSLLLHATAAALALACTPLGLLLAYRASDAVARVVTADSVVFTVPLSAAVLATLLLAGISLVLLSTGMLTLLRSLAKPGPGLLLWLALVLALHASLFQVHWWAGQPVGLGKFLPWLADLLTRTVFDPSHSFYMTELLGQALGKPLIVFVVALTVLLASAYIPQRPAAVLPAWLVPATAVLCAALRAAFQTYAWSHDMTSRYPGNWSGVLSTGLLALLLGHWLLAWDKRQSADWRTLLGELLWSWWALSACAVCTLPYISAGQGEQLEVLWGLLCVLAIASPGLLLVRRLGALRTAASGLGAALLMLALIAIVVPLGAAQPPLLASLAQTLGLAIQKPEQAPNAYWVLGAAACLSLLIWPWPRRRSLSRSKLPSTP